MLVLKVHKDPQASQEQKGIRVFRALQVQLVLLVLRDQRELPVQKVTKANKVLQVRLVHKDPQAPLALKDFPDLQALLERKALKV